MFSLMGNCISWTKGKNERLPVTLLTAGLDNAGKTTTVQGVKGNLTTEVAPTVGFASLDVRYGKYNVKIFDLGGGSKIRGIWQNYMSEVHGIIYVIDSSDNERMDECRQAFENLISDDRLRGKPVLILANKQDKPEAVDELDLCNLMNLDEVVNRNECYSKVVLCSALPIHGKKRQKRTKLDRGIKNGFLWLLDMIGNDYENLQVRIEKDVKQQKQREAEERELKIERVRKRREERERLEKNGESVAEEPTTAIERPRPEGISHHELPNDTTPSTSDNIPGAIVPDTAIQKTSGLGESLMSEDDDVVPIPIEQGPSSPPGMVLEGTASAASPVTESRSADQNENSRGDNAEQFTEHPRALSTASLRELVRDTPTPTTPKDLIFDERVPDKSHTVLPSLQSKPDSIISLQNENEETASVSSGTVERKRKKKKKKHRKQNRIDPRASDDNRLSESSHKSETLQGKLTPIKAYDSNASSNYGKLPPISNAPNYDSDVEL